MVAGLNRNIVEGRYVSLTKFAEQGVNTTYRAKMKLPTAKRASNAVVKYATYCGGRDHENEAVVAKLAALTGLVDVPRGVWRDLPESFPAHQRQGWVQEFVANKGTGYSNRVDLREDAKPADLLDLHIFDYLLANDDRHFGNLLVRGKVPNGKRSIVAIDHGLCLDDDRTAINAGSPMLEYLQGIYGEKQPCTLEQRAGIKNALDKWGEIEAVAKAVHNTAALPGLKARLVNLNTTGRISISYNWGGWVK